jgi:hypothetical protein
MSSIPKNELIISPATISTTQISQYFNLEKKELNQIFLELQWIQRKYFLWLVTTGLGEEKGAIKEHKEIQWSREILGDTELIIAIKDFKNEEENPILYKMKIEKKYHKEGYTVWEYSKEKGIYDKNIHFVAKKDKKVLLIHCRTNKKDITLDDIISFEENKKKFITENPIFEIYNVKLQYTMSSFSLTEEAFKYLKEKKKEIYYEIIKQS